ncbi:MAG: DUF5596 domain-containing protein [Clostridia bacterium]|nr:DUF5596 domain-containing protein [Clostridia bacterium]
MYTIPDPDYIKNIMRITGMPEDAISEVSDAYENLIARPDFAEAAREAVRATIADESSRDMLWDYAGKVGIRPRLLLLIICYICTPVTEKLFAEQGLSREIYLDSLSDITVWAKVAKKEWDGWGMQEYGWIQRTLRGKLYKFGRMQFELEEFDQDEYVNEKLGVYLKRGDTVINCHIPEGDSLTLEKRLDSYKRAEEFFKSELFVMESYLLYLPLRNYLPEGSNLLLFMDDYEIIASWDDPGMGDMWRIFGMHSDYTRGMPQDTRLQRAFSKMIAEQGATGKGYGVRIGAVRKNI